MSDAVICAQIFGSVDVRAIRRRLKLSQAEFAARFCFTAARIRDWEQGRSRPDNAVRAYLTLIDHAPDMVEHALSNYATRQEEQRT